MAYFAMGRVQLRDEISLRGLHTMNTYDTFNTYDMNIRYIENIQRSFFDWSALKNY